jgi:CRP/FNR family cyclic AMP-dependent transcriptional regulator
MDRIADRVVLDRLATLSKIDILADLNRREMQTIMDAAPMRSYAAGELLYTPHRPVEVLFLLKQGRVRVFRVSAEGRALTTAIVPAGTIFGEMVLLGQRMYDNYAEAVDETLTCVMSRADVHRLLLSDPRIAARIAEILGRRLVQMGAPPVRHHVQDRPASHRRDLVHPGPRSASHRYDSRIRLSRARSLALARRIAPATTGAVTLANPAGSPRLRNVIRVLDAPSGCQV